MSRLAGRAVSPRTLTPRGPINLGLFPLVIVAMLATVLIVGPAGEAAAQAVVPFDCDGTPYIMQNGRMYQVVPDPADAGQFLFEEVGTQARYGNSLGFDPTTNLVYGVRRISGRWNVLTYDATWSTVNQQEITGVTPGKPFPRNGSSYAGTVIGDGSYIIATYNAAVPGSTRHNLWSVDGASGNATWIGPISPQSPTLADFAYNPGDGFMYHITQGNLHQLNPLTGAKINLGSVPGAGGGYGSSYFDAAGNLFVHQNSGGALIKVSGIGTGSYTTALVATTGRVSGSDAASCVGEIDLLKDVVDSAGTPVPLADRSYAPGDIVLYEFTIINNALPTGPQSLIVCDALPVDGRSYTGVATSTAFFSFNPPVSPGDTSFCLDVTVPSSLWADPASPGGDPVTITVEVELGSSMLPGEYANQATLESPLDPGDLVLSDDPGDVSDPEDATTIQVTGEFTVDKEVATHPSGNDTDTFVIEVSCTDADGVGFNVTPDMVVDAAGDPWPGAGTNTFPIRHGERPRVIDLSADATCAAVENPVPAAYALEAASNDVSLPNGGEMVIDQAPGQEFVTLRNLTGEFALSKFVSEPPSVAAPLDLNGTFPIEVACQLNGVQVLPPTVYQVPVTDGVSGTLSYPDLPLLPHLAECSAAEQVPAGWDGSTDPVFFQIDLATPALAQFMNTRQVAQLEITKTISGLPAGTLDTDFSFEVTVTCTDGFQNPSEVFGPFSLATNDPQSQVDLPVGSTCAVVETPTEEFSPVYSPAGGVVAIAPAGSSVAIENVTGTLIIRKDTIVPTVPPTDPTGDFDFAMECSLNGSTFFSDTVTVAVTDTTPTSGATGGITYGDPQIPLLPPGTQCTITEQVPAGWTLTSPASATITVPADGVPPTAAFINERPTADLTLTKSVQGLPTGVDPASFSFPVTVVCSDPSLTSDYTAGPLALTPGTDIVIENLPVGASCAVTEDADDRFTPTLPANPTVIDADGSAITIVNSTQALTIEKTTTADDPTIDLSDTFPFTVVCDNGTTSNVSVTTDATGAGAITYPDLPLYADGTTCTVTETVPSGWELMSANGVEVELVGGGTPSGTPAGNALVSDNCQDGAGNAPFNLQIRNATPDPTEWQMIWRARPYATIPNLSAGDYTHAVIDNGDGSYDHVFTGTLTLAGWDGVTITGSVPTPPGNSSCASVERFILDGGGTSGGGDSSSGTAAFVNARVTSDLAITKTVAGLPAGESPNGYTFTVDVLCTGDFVGGSRTFSDVTLTTAGATIEDLPTGAVCTVAEEPSDEFVASYPNGDTETIADQDNTVAVVNTTSSFAIEKSTLVPPGVAPDATFVFVWTCDNAATTSGTTSVTTSGGTGTTTFAGDDMPLLPDGTTCTVTEAPLTGWTATATTVDVTLDAAGVELASFTNTRDVGSIVITKSIVGLPSSADVTGFDFDVTVTCTGDFETPFSFTGTFKAGETITVDELPTGATCTVVEEDDPQWTPLYDPVGGEVIVAEGQNDVAIVNSTGELIIFKENFVPSTQQIEPREMFDFEITCRFGSNVVFGPTVFELDANSITPTGSVGGIGYDELGITFDPGTICSIQELGPPAGWSILTSPNPIEIEITADGAATAEFENQRDVGTLTITKDLAGLPDGVSAASFSFDIEVICNHEDLPANYKPLPTSGSLPLTISPGTPIEFADLPTGAVCAVDETATPEFAATLPAAVTIDTDGETLAIVNTTRTLTISKTATTTSTLPLDLRETFEFDVVCTNGFSTMVAATTDADGSASVGYPAIDLLADGTSCTVTEVTPISTHWTLVTPNGVTADMTGANGAAAFTNTLASSQLTIDKTVVGLPSGQPVPSFTVDVVCTGGFLDPGATPSDTRTFSGLTLPVTGTVIGGLPIGTSCEIAENPNNSYLPSYPDGQTATIDADGETLQIINETSTFEMLKTTVVPAGVSDAATFTLDWSCSDPALSSGSATRVGAGAVSFAGNPPLVPVGTTCTVTEDAVPTGWTATTNPVVVVTATGGPVTAEIVNTRDTGSLTVTKAIQGFPGTPGALDAELFDITVTCIGDFTPSTAVFTRQISVDNPTTITDLPVGAQCSVIEAPDGDGRFFIVYAPGSTTIAAGENSLGVINVTGELMVQKNTIVNSPHPVSAIGSFPVQIVCSDSNGEYFNEVRPVTIDMVTATATGSVGTGGIGYDEVPLLADGSACTVTEVNIPAGWTETTSPPPGTLVIDTDAPVTAVLENTRDVGTLTVTKTIEGLPAPLDAEDYAFDITVACSGGGLAGGYTIPITVTPGTPVDIEDLPTGAACTASEDDPDPQFAPTFPATPTEITAAGATLPIVNTTTSFSITKTASATSALPVDLVDTFTFSITCGSEDPVTVMATTDALGLADLDHTDGLPLVAPGTLCTVTETALPGWTETSTIAPFTTVAGTTPRLDFTNERDLAALTINKTIDGLPAAANPDLFGFVVDVSCTGELTTAGDPYEVTGLPLSTALGGSPGIAGIPTGASCTVTEVLPADSPFTPSYSPAATITMTSDRTVSITNTTSTFAIEKTTVVPALADEDATFTFDYVCNDVAGSSGVATITTTGGSGTFTFDTDPANPLPLVPPGTECSIDETALPAGWVVTESPLVIITSATNVATAAFENTRDDATLTISKTILGLTAIDPLPNTFTFPVEIDCIGDFPPGLMPLSRTINVDADIVIENLPTGATCTITEDPGAEFAAVYGPANTDGTAAEVVLDSPNVGVAITNLTGRVSWVKQTVVPPEQGIDPVETFSFSVTCTTPGGATTTQTVAITTSNLTAAGAVGIPDEADFPLQPAGTICQITELGPPTGWTLTSTPNPVAVTISPDPNPGVFINERDAADLRIVKVIEGLPSAIDAASLLFEVNVTCDHPDLLPPIDYEIGPLLVGTTNPATVANLPTGAQCTTVETADPAYATSYQNQSVTIADGETTTITNSTGTLEITKTTTATDPTLVDLAGTFTFDVVCDGGINTTVDVTTDAAGTGTVGYPDLGLIPEGGSCTVTEQDPGALWAVTDDEISETITNGVATAAFTNTRATAPLTVTKVIEGGPAGILDAELFGLVISCESGFADEPYEPSGAQVSVNEPYTLGNLPTGAVCTVSEVADPLNRFAISYSPNPAEVTIADTVGAAVMITNATGELIVSKQTIIPAGREIDPTGTFTFDFRCINPLTSIPVFTGERNVVVTMLNATPFGASAGIRYDDLPLMPDGTECVITEQEDPAGLWTLTSANNVPVTISSADPVTAEFENTRNVASLRITKELAGLPNGAFGDFDDEPFEVTIECTGDFTGATYTTTGTVSVNGALQIDSLPTEAQCEITESEDPRFQPSYAPQTIRVGEAGAASTITNTTGELVLMKETIIPSTHPINPVATFNFELSCTSPEATIPLPTIPLQVTPDVSTSAGAIGGIRYDEIDLLADGTTCIVTETALPADWTLTSANDIEITIDSQAPVTAPFVNTHDVGDLVITKETLGLPADIAAASLAFPMTATCNHPNLIADYLIDFVLSGDGSYTIEALPANAVCVVEEAEQSEYATAYTPVGGQVTIVKDGEVTVDIVNETSYFSLTKTGIADGPYANLANTFLFDITCTNGFTGQVSVVTDVTGTGSIDHNDGLPLVPPAGSCTVVEATASLPDGWVFESPADGQITVAAGDDDRGEIVFVNRRQVTPLTITKIIEGLPASIPVDSPTFGVTVTCAGDFAPDAPLTFDITVAVDSPVVLEDLPTDAVCQVVEDDAPAYGTTTSPDTGIVILEDTAGSGVDITNSTATFSITKQATVTSALPVDLEQTFTFDYLCSTPGGTELARGSTDVATAATTTGAEGVADFDSAAPNNLPMLPDGAICTVTERAVADWTPTSDVIQVLTLDSAEVQTAVFTNDRDVVDLTITKDIVGLPAGLVAADYTFPATVTCMGDFIDGSYSEDVDISTVTPVEIVGIPAAAECTVVENLPAASPFIASYLPSNGAAILDADTTIGVTNTTSTFEIVKTTVVPALAESDATFVFEWVCDDPGQTTGSATIATQDGQGVFAHASAPGSPASASASPPLLPPGTSCEIAETNLPSGWTVDESPQTIESATTAPVVAFVNTRAGGDLEVTKTIVGLQPSDPAPESYAFVVDVTCTGDYPGGTFTATDQPVTTDEPLIIPDMPTGATCLISEQTPLGFPFTPVYGPATADGTSAEIVIAPDENTTTIANLAGKASWVKQTIVPDTHPINPVAAFSFDVECTAPDGTVFADIVDVTTSELTASGAIGVPNEADFPPQPAGSTCIIAELEAGPEWALISTPNPVELTISPTTEPAQFVNERQTGSLTVTNTVQGLPVGADPADYVFTFTLSCAGGGLPDGYLIGPFTLLPGESVTFDDLPVGSTCMIIQDPSDQFQVELPPSVSILGGENALLPVINRTGTLTITKAAAAPQSSLAPATATFVFAVSCTNGYSGSHEIAMTIPGTNSLRWPEIPLFGTGTTCEVTEQPAQGWLLTGVATVTTVIETGDVASVAYRNEYQFGRAPSSPIAPPNVAEAPVSVAAVPQPAPIPSEQPLAYTGGPARSLASFAMLLLSLGFAAAGFGRRLRRA